MTYLRQILTSGDYEQSSGNTSTTPLGSGSTFTGTGELNGWSDVMVVCKTDNTGTLYFDFSPDGTNWDSTFPPLGFSVADGINEFHTAVKGPRYFRVRLVNDTGAQSYLRLYVYYGHFKQGNLPLNASIGIDSDATVVRPTNPQEEISLGRVSGEVAWSKFGHRSLLAAGGDETVWNTTGNYVPPTVATAMRITYDGTAGGTTDGAGTNGAHTLSIDYIDSDGLPANLSHVLGTDGSDDTVETTLGINRVQVIAAGSDEFNASEILITAVTGGATLAEIEAETSVTQQAIFHCGANHTALFEFLYLHFNKSGGGAASVQFKGFVFVRSLGVTYEVFRTTLDDSVEVSLSLNPIVPFKVPATGVIYFTANTTRDGAEAIVRFSGNEFQNA